MLPRTMNANVPGAGTVQGPTPAAEGRPGSRESAKRRVDRACCQSILLSFLCKG